MRSAWQVGALVVLFGVLLVGALSVLQANVFAPQVDRYYAKFEDAGGLTVGSPVLLAGVKVGEVGEVGLDGDGLARVVLELEKGRRLARGTVAVLPTSFISIGDKQVLLRREGTGTGFVSANDPGDVIPGVLQGPLDEVFPDTEATMAELNKTMQAFQRLLNDDELRQGLLGVMKAGEGTAAQFGSLASNLDGTLARNSGRIDTLMRGMVSTMGDMQAVTQEIRAFAESGSLQRQADELMSTINSAAKEGELLVKDLRQVTGDPATQASLKETMSNFETMSGSGVRIAADAEVMAKNGVEISAQTKELIAKANALADEVAKLLDEFKGTVDRIVPRGGQSLLPEVGVEADLTIESEPRRARVDANILVPVGRDKVVLGLYDAFESNKLNLQLQRRLNERTDLRYGVYASKPGVGVSSRVAPNLWLRGDVFGLNDPQLDVRLRYDIRSDFHAWLGMERVFGKNSPSFGLGVRR